MAAFLAGKYNIKKFTHKIEIVYKNIGKSNLSNQI